MDLLTNYDSIIELIIYAAIFIGIVIYTKINYKKNKSEQNEDENIIIQDSNQKNNTALSWKKSNNRNNTPYKISSNKDRNPIFSSSVNNISYTRTLMIFIAVAAAALLIVAYLTENF